MDHFGALTSLPCLAIFGPKWTIFGPSLVMNGRPQSKKKAHHHVSYVWPACGTPSLAVWNINMVAIYEKCQFSLHCCYVKITIFLPMVSKIKLRFYLKPVNREYPYSSVGMRAAAIIAMCRTLCPYSPAHKILGNRTTYFSTTHACFQISRKLARCETNS